MDFSTDSKPILTLMNSIKNATRQGLDLQPTYQRGYVWNDDFKDKLIYSIIKGYPIGNINIRILDAVNEKNAKSEVVDGQQRLTTIYNFIYKDYVIKGEFARKIIVEIKNYLTPKGAVLDVSTLDTTTQKLLKKLSNKGTISLKYSQLPELIQDNMDAYNIALTNISNASDDQISEYFKFLQNQERLRAGEIINSLPATSLEQYLNKIINKEGFLTILNFSDDRREFDKIFYSIIGVFDKKISLGTTDKVIQEYVANSTTFTQPTTLQYINSMIDNINHISTLSTTYSLQTNKRYLKLLLLLAGFNFINFRVDTLEKLQKLEDINNKLSSFNSAKENIVAQTFTGFSDDDINKYRLVALVAKGAQRYDTVIKRMKILSTLF